MVKRSVKLIVLIISLILIIGLIAIFTPSSYEAPLMTTHLSNYSLEDSEDLVNIDLSESIDSVDVSLEENTILILNFNEEIYLFELSKLTKNKAGLFFSNAELNYLFYLNQERKIDLNFDGTYDCLIILKEVGDEKAVFSFESIIERVDAGDDIDFLMDKFKGDIQQEVSMQNYIIFGLLILVFIYILFNIIFVYVLPYIRNKELMKRRKPFDAIKYLYSQIKKEKSPQRRSSLYNRIVHLYDYLSEKDKREIKNKLSEKDKKEIQEIMNSIKFLKSNKWGNL